MTTITIVSIIVAGFMFVAFVFAIFRSVAQHDDLMQAIREGQKRKDRP